MGDLKFLISHYVYELWKRRWSILALAWLAGLGTAYMAARAPDVYESQAIVNVNTRKLLATIYGPDVYLGNPSAEVESVRKLMYTRPTLTDIIHRSDLHLDVKDQRGMEALLKSLQENLIFARPGENTYRIAYTNTSPETARRVVQAAVDRFIALGLDQSGGGKAEQDRALRVLREQLETVNADLEVASAKLNDFERDNRQLLAPSATVTSQLNNLEADLRQLQSEETFERQEISRLQGELARTEQQIITRYDTPPAAVRAQSPRPDVYEVPVPSAQTTLEEQRYQTVQAQVSQLEEQLQQLLRQYTPQHPDVLRMQERVNQAQGQLASARADADGARSRQQAEIDAAIARNTEVRRILEDWRYQNSQPVPQAEPRPVYGPNPMYAQLESTIGQHRSRMTVISQRMDSVRDQIRDVRSTLLEQPEIIDEYRRLSREREDLATKREEVLANIDRIETTIQAQDSGTMDFEVKEAPERAVTPIGPNRMLLFASSAIMSLGLGGGLAFLRIQMAENMPTIAHVRSAFDMPILGSVSAIQTSGRTAKSALSNLLFILLFAAFVMMFAFLIYKFHVQLWRPDIDGLVSRVRGALGGLL